MNEITEVCIWEPIKFPENWLSTNTSKLDELAPSWYRKRSELKEGNEAYEEFITRLKRQHAIETGIVEKLYNLKEGITETFIKEGFVESYLSHDDTNIPPQQLMSFLKDHFEAMDFIFDVVKQNRPLTKGFIKELHQLITKNQDFTIGIDGLGRQVQIPLIKGDWKQAENNPKRDDNTVYTYCPPIHVDSEMEQLISIYHELNVKEINPVIISAWTHHAFTQIHPFQDGNGRIARLLASLILIKGGLFPFTVKRNEKVKYINALEKADQNEPQELVSFFCEIEKSSIENILNFKSEKIDVSLSEIALIFNEKIEELQSQNRERRQKQLETNRNIIFNLVYSLVGEVRNELDLIIPHAQARVRIKSVLPSQKDYFWYNRQIADYATIHNYYFNKLLPRGWFQFSFCISSDQRYDLIISIHHYSYDDSVIAIGSFLEFAEKREGVDELTTIPIMLKPYTISLEADPKLVKSNIEYYIRDIVKIGLTIITNEIN